MNKEQFIRDFMDEVWNGKNVGALAKYIDPSYKIHLDTADPWEGKTLTLADYEERLQFSFKSFPDIHFEITSTISEDHHVAITWILTGTNSGTIGSLPPTNKSIKTKGITIYYFRDDRICGHSQVFDRQKVMVQLGF